MAYLMVEGSRHGRHGSAWLSPGGWFFMFEDGDVRLRGCYVSYYSTVGKCKKVLGDRIAILRPVAGQLPCPELVEYLEEELLWLNDFLPESRIAADFGDLDELFFSEFRRSDLYEDERWLPASRAGAGRCPYLLPAVAEESFHAYAAFNTSQWMKVVRSGRWDWVEDGLRFIGIADDVWGDPIEGRGIMIGFEGEASLDFPDDQDAEGPEARRLSPEGFLEKLN